MRRLAAPSIAPLVDWLGRGYLVAVLATALATAVRFALEPWIGAQAPLLPYFAAVMLAAWAGGFWPGLLATVLSGISAAYALASPGTPPAVHEHSPTIVLALFALVSLGISILCDALHRYRRQAQQRAEHLEQALVARERAEQHLLVALEAGAMGTWRVDYRTGELAYSPKVGPMFGHEPGFVHASMADWSACVHPADRERTIAATVGALNSSDPSADMIEYRIVRPDGSIRWLHSRGRAEGDAEGRRVTASGVVQDVTEIRQRNEHLAALDEAVPQIVWISDAAGYLQFLNKRWRDYTGVDPDASLAFAWLGAVHPDDLEPVQAAWSAAVERAGPLETELRLRAADGTYRWFLARALPRPGPSGDIERWYGSCTDIDRAKVTEQVLRDQEAELMAADRRKDVFLATLAHELRNPLAPVRYALKLLAAGTPPDVVAGARAMIERQLGHMTRLVDDLMDVSRITRGVLELQPARLDLREVIESAVQASRPLVEAEAHVLDVALPGEPIPVNGDAVRLAQVIGNLLNNAVKYTERGGRIDVRARVVRGSAEVVVRDTGIGIEPAMLPRVFELFSQVDRSSHRVQGGLGIGLSLSRRLVLLHGGSIDAHSEGLGRGSEFVVRLPMAPAEAARPGGERDNVVPLFRGRLRIVLADDNVDATVALSQLLEMSGYATHVAYDGVAAVELAESTRPDVVLLDLGMPRLNGFDAARRIRAQPWGRSPTLIAITGWGQDSDRQRTLEAGLDEHLTKPVDPDELLRRLAAIGAAADTGEPAARARRAEPCRP